ncbi:hypothetical protein RR48_11318 [Papilio machaon]|uniref:Uncharacterized protein n=1 Tax=Papilio machaon TaxID=76193 RepID=A0A194QN86_PAPMA|nr:hypothetical protein RR48_11318 [Papilio machaon]
MAAKALKTARRRKISVEPSRGNDRRRPNSCPRPAPPRGSVHRVALCTHSADESLCRLTHLVSVFVCATAAPRCLPAALRKFKTIPSPNPAPSHPTAHPRPSAAPLILLMRYAFSDDLS